MITYPYMVEQIIYAKSMNQRTLPLSYPKPSADGNTVEVQMGNATLDIKHKDHPTALAQMAQMAGGGNYNSSGQISPTRSATGLNIDALV